MNDPRKYRLDTTLEHSKFIFACYGDRFGEKYIQDSIEMCEPDHEEYWLKVQSDFVELIKTEL